MGFHTSVERAQRAEVFLGATGFGLASHVAGETAEKSPEASSALDSDGKYPRLGS